MGRIQVDTSVRTSSAVKKGLDKLSNTMTTASDALTGLSHSKNQEILGNF